MEFVDLKAQYNALKKDIDAAIQDVLASGDYIMGKKVAELEERLQEYTGRKYCITCANGTDALSMVLLAWGIKGGDAVFVPSFSFIATAEVVSFCGAEPVFVDIDLDTFNIDADSLEKAIKEVISKGELNPKVVIPVDLFGLPADYEKIIPIAKKYGILVLEDGAQGFGGRLAGRNACGFGEASATSFFPAKPLGCYGDGGAIFTDDEKLYSDLSSIRVHGKGKDKYNNIRTGLNSRLDTLQAAILLVKLKAFTEYELLNRQKIAELYTSQLGDFVRTPVIPDKFSSSYAQYTILLDNEEKRSVVQTKLRENNIPSMIYYPLPLHLQPAFGHLEYTEGCLPNSEKASKCVLSLPMHPYLNEHEIKTTAEVISSIK